MTISHSRNATVNATTSGHAKAAAGFLALCVIALVLSVTACSANFTAYSRDMFQGNDLLTRQEYEQARTSFLRAYDELNNPEALIFAATACYKMGDLPAAERYLNDAERLLDGKTQFLLRIVGYKALVLLKAGRKEEGIDALNRYVHVYQYLFPLMNIADVQTMAAKNAVDLSKLEKLLDEQISKHESDVKQLLETGTGFLARPQFIGR